MSVTFLVYGAPEPQGSARAFLPRGWTRPVITSDNPRLHSWRQEVKAAALRAMCSAHTLMIRRPAPVRLEVVCYFPRPKSQRRAAWKTTRPDADKLLRGVLDALTGVVYEDDAQVVQCCVSKRFGQPARAEITIADAYAYASADAIAVALAAANANADVIAKGDV